MEDGSFKFSILSKFPEIIHGVSKRAYGNMKEGWSDKADVSKNRKLFCSELNIDSKTVVMPEIVHGAEIKVVGKNDLGNTLKGADGLVTAEKVVFLMVTIADCFPIFIYDPVTQIVALAHAGWKGIINKISLQLIEKLQGLGSDPNNLIVGLGPGICQKHFVVKKDVLTLFQEEYPQAAFIRNHDGYIDLRKALIRDFQKLGISKHNIEVANDCPACHNGIYGSFRKEGVGAPASAAVIGIKGS